jgi:C-terminal processing protease CtpA/Prc
MKLSRAMLALALLVVSAPAAGGVPAASAPADSARIQRIVKLGELWGEIRFRHPFLAYKSIDWDSALVVALPKADAAPDPASYARVVEAMLAKLGDPATHLYPSEKPDSSLHPADRPFFRWSGSTLIVSLATAGRRGFTLEPELGSLAEEIPKAKAVVLDARLRGAPSPWGLEDTFVRIITKLFSGELSVPGSRFVQYSGYPSQGRAGSGGYTLGFDSRAGKVLNGTPGTKPGRIVFVLDTMSPIPVAVLALRQRGASIVCEGGLNDAAVAETRLDDAGEGVRVEYRVEELELPFEADARFPLRLGGAGGAKGDPALEKAIALAGVAVVKRRPPPVALPPAIFRKDRTYAETPYPDRAHRQLAAIKYWVVIQRFYPYLKLLDGAWDTALARFLPRFEAAADARDYAAAVLEMSTLVKDGHTFLTGGRISDVIGRYPGPALDAFEIDGKPVVVRVGATAAVEGVVPGDVIEAVDGEPIGNRVRRLEAYVTAATPAALRRSLIARALLGADTLSVRLSLRGASGVKEVKVPRTQKGVMEMRETGDHYKVLPGNVGYVVMERLQVPEVEEMFLKFKDTRAIIFDMRGYPNGTAWAIAPHINTRGAKIGAVFERPMSKEGTPMRLKFEQPIPPVEVPLYRGRTLTLIDERAISQSEHTCLFFEAANGTTFVGSPTAGANGDITMLALPGGIYATFTGHDVRHADGRQLQRLGIQPDVAVRPTIAGLRAGRDEVLERALAVIAAGSGGGAPGQ